MSRKRGPDLKAWIEPWQGRYAKLVAWVEENIEETLTYFSLPQAHHRNMKSTNMLERFNEEIKRRNRVVRIFPNEASCLRLVRALAGSGAARELAGGQPLHQHGAAQGDEARAAEGGGLRLARVHQGDWSPSPLRHPRSPDQASDGGSEGMASPDRHDIFAELDGHN